MVTNTYLALCILLILPFMYEMSHRFRYLFKFFMYYSVVMFNSVLFIPYMLCYPFDVRNLITSSYCITPVSKVIGLKWELRGREHLEPQDACIIVSNHQSSLDILGMFHIWPIMGRCTVIAKKEIFYVWPFGLVAWLSGLIFIDRFHSDKAKKLMNNCTDFLIKTKTKLWVFPEGTRRNTNEIHSFKKGAFHVAINAQLPILPVVFSSYTTFLDKKNKHFDAGTIIIEALPKISTVGLTSDDLEELLERTRAIMIDKFKVNTKELQSKSTSKLVTNNANNCHNKTNHNNQQQQSVVITNGGGDKNTTNDFTTNPATIKSSSSHNNLEEINNDHLVLSDKFLIQKSQMVNTIKAQ